jgi:hypothetical protein
MDYFTCCIVGFSVELADIDGTAIRHGQAVLMAQVGQPVDWR